MEMKTETRAEKPGMKMLAEKEISHYTAPLPEAQMPASPSFPAALWRYLWIGIGAGALAGLGFGNLLFTNTLVVPGWEALYSMGPAAFHAFWILMGIAAGILAGGVGSILALPAPGWAKEKDSE
jgi:hypothetical protein